MSSHVSKTTGSAGLSFNRKRNASAASTAANNNNTPPHFRRNSTRNPRNQHKQPPHTSPRPADDSPTPKRSKKSPEYVVSSAGDGGSDGGSDGSDGEGNGKRIRNRYRYRNRYHHGNGGSDSGYDTRQNSGFSGFEDFRAPRNRTMSESGRPAWMMPSSDVPTETRSTSPVCGGSPGPTSPSPGPSTPVAQASHCSTAPVWSAAGSPSPAPAAGIFTPPSPSLARSAMASSPAEPETASPMSPMSRASPPAQPTPTATTASPPQPTPTATTASPPQPVVTGPPPPLLPALRQTTAASAQAPAPRPHRNIAFVSKPEIIQAPHYSQYSQLSQQSLSQHSSDHPPQLPFPPPPQRPLFLLPTPSDDYVQHNPRYPAIVRELETAPISNAQLVAETKSIYVGLSLVEAKVIEVVARQNQVLAAAQAAYGARGARGARPVAAAIAASSCSPPMDQWRALVSLHRTLLQEHNDFLLASQHPAASPALRRVAHKYAMPSRLWRHGIHGFLELLRRHLPASREPMESFLYIAYSMLALLVETVPSFEDTWVECLGDVARYRMAIEEASQHTRDVWTAVARRWYTVASDRAPATGRLYHHLGILARPRIVAQLFWYTKALCVGVPFVATRESILTLLEPALHRSSNTQPPMIHASGGNAAGTTGTTGTAGTTAAVELAFVRSHGLLFLRAHPAPAGRPASAWADAANPTVEEARVDHLRTLLAGLDTSVHRSGRAWIAVGAQMAVVNSCALLQYGADGNPLLQLLKQVAGDVDGAEGVAKQQQEEEAEEAHPTADTVAALAPACELVQAMDRIVLARVGDANTYGYAHVRLVFLEMAARLPSLMRYVEHAVPWAALALYLNGMLLAFRHAVAGDAEQHSSSITKEVLMEAPPPYDKASSLAAWAASVAAQGSSFTPTPAVTTQEPAPPPPRATRPLPEDWALQCLLFADRLFPTDWFAGQDGIDDGERLLEAGSMVVQRMERCLWLGVRVARKGQGQWLTYEDGQFGVAPRWREEEEDVAEAEANEGDENKAGGEHEMQGGE